MPFPYPVASHTLAAHAFANESWMWVALVFGAASIFILTFTYRKSPLRGPQKFFAATLKLVGLILLALILMEPVILDELPKKNANEVAIIYQYGVKKSCSWLMFIFKDQKKSCSVQENSH